MKNLFTYILIFFALNASIFGGVTGKIQGKVTDTDGVALPGANVMLDGTNRGMSSDLNGEYIFLSVK